MLIIALIVLPIVTVGYWLFIRRESWQFDNVERREHELCEGEK